MFHWHLWLLSSTILGQLHPSQFHGSCRTGYVQPLAWPCFPHQRGFFFPHLSLGVKAVVSLPSCVSQIRHYSLIFLPFLAFAESASQRHHTSIKRKLGFALTYENSVVISTFSYKETEAYQFSWHCYLLIFLLPWPLVWLCACHPFLPVLCAMLDLAHHSSL